MSLNLIPVMIAGVGYGVPDTVITNDDLTKLVDTSDEWITTRTGIKERRVVSGEENAVTLGIKAAKNALEKAKMDPMDIDMIIAAASVPAHPYPSTACEIQAAIGADNAAAYDITAACTGMIYAMNIAKVFIREFTRMFFLSQRMQTLSLLTGMTEQAAYFSVTEPAHWL